MKACLNALVLSFLLVGRIFNVALKTLKNSLIVASRKFKSFKYKVFHHSKAILAVVDCWGIICDCWSTFEHSKINS